MPRHSPLLILISSRHIDIALPLTLRRHFTPLATAAIIASSHFRFAYGLRLLTPLRYAFMITIFRDISSHFPRRLRHEFLRARQSEAARRLYCFRRFLSSRLPFFPAILLIRLHFHFHADATHAWPLFHCLSMLLMPFRCPLMLAASVIARRRR